MSIQGQASREPYLQIAPSPTSVVLITTSCCSKSRHIQILCPWSNMKITQCLSLRATDKSSPSPFITAFMCPIFLFVFFLTHVLTKSKRDVCLLTFIIILIAHKYVAEVELERNEAVIGWSKFRLLIIGALLLLIPCGVFCSCWRCADNQKCSFLSVCSILRYGSPCPC